MTDHVAAPAPSVAVPSLDYDAFLSYSTRSDYREVRELKLFLERFHLMDPSRGQPHPTAPLLTPLKACVDGIDFKRPRSPLKTPPRSSHQSSLWDVIDTYLGSSRFLVVLCSPATSQSSFVSDEIRHFCQLRNDPTGNQILLAVTSGDPQAAPESIFPPAALELGLHEREAWIDLRSVRPGGEPERGVRDRSEERVRLAEILTGVEKGTLIPVYYREQRRLSRRRFRVVTLIATIVTALALLAGWQWLMSQFHLLDSYASLAGTEATRTAESHPSYALAMAEYSLRTGNHRSGLQLVDHILRQLPDYATYGDADSADKPALFIDQRPAALAFLRNNASVLAWTQGKPPLIIQLNTNREALPLTTEPAYLLTIDSSGTVVAVATETSGLRVFSVERPDQPKEIFRLQGQYRSIVLGEQGAILGAITSDNHGLLFRPAAGSAPFLRQRNISAMALDASLSHAAVLVAEDNRARADLLDLKTGRVIRSVSTDILRSRRLLHDEYVGLLSRVMSRTSSPDRLESLAGPIDPLDLTGWLTATASDTLAAEDQTTLGADLKSIDSQSDRSEPGVLRQGAGDIGRFASVRIKRHIDFLASKKDLYACQPSLAFLADPPGLLVSCNGGARLPFEIIDLDSGRVADRREGLFSLISVHPGGRALALAGPKLIRLNRLDLSSSKQPLLDHSVFPSADISKRLGVPKVLAFGPRGTYLAAAYVPYLQLQGAPPSTLILALTARSDTRDGNAHHRVDLRPNHRAISALAFDAEGTRLAALYVNGAVRVWKLMPEKDVERNLAKFGFCAFRYMPREAFSLNGATFETIDAFTQALHTLSRHQLSPVETARVGLPPRPNAALLTLKRVASPGLKDTQIHWPIREDRDDGCPWFGPKKETNLIAFQSDLVSLDRQTCFDRDDGRYRPLACNSDLRQLVSDVLLDRINSSDAAARYWKLLEADPLLASGIQVRIAADDLKEGLSGRAADAIVVALAGDRRALLILKNLSEKDASSYELAAKRWAVRFLEAHGRDTSVSGFLKTANPDTLTVVDYLAWPMVVPGKRPHVVVPTKLDDRARQVIARHSNIVWDDSLSPVAFALLSINKDLPRLHYMASEYFVHENDFDAAWRYIDASIMRAPTDAQYLNWAGFILLRRDEPQRALKYFEESIRAGRSDGWPHVNMARAFTKTNERERAEAAYDFLTSPRIKPRLREEYAEQLEEFAVFLRDSWPNDSGRRAKAKGLLALSFRLSSDIDTLLTLVRWLDADGHLNEAISVLSTAERESSRPEQREKIQAVRKELEAKPRS